MTGRGHEGIAPARIAIEAAVRRLADRVALRRQLMGKYVGSTIIRDRAT